MGVSSRWCRFWLLDEQGSVVAAGVVAGGLEPDLETVSLIARLSLMAKRAGRTLEIGDASRELLDLLELTGVTDVLVGPPPDRDGATRRGGPAIRRSERAASDPGSPERSSSTQSCRP